MAAGIFLKAGVVAVGLSGGAWIGAVAADIGRLDHRASFAPAPSAAARTDALAAVREAMASVVSLDIEGNGAKTAAAAFVVDGAGLLATAAHVAPAGARITAVLADGRRLPALLVGRDEMTDVAVLRIAAGGPLIPLRFAMGHVRAGQQVAAVGAPLGYRQTLTAGVVSAPRRDYGAASPYGFIQHDAALNPGSSGGPLLNLDGEVVGMNAAIADGGRRHVGIGLAIPAAVARRIAGRLISDGAIPRPALGLRLRAAAELATEGAATGLAIEEVAPGSAAARAGLAPGQIIETADGAPMSHPRDLARALEPRAPGDVLILRLRDQHGVREASVTLGPPAAPPPALAKPAAHRPFGVALKPGGATIGEVAPRSAAAAAGLRSGDRVLAVGLRPVGPHEARDVIGRTDGDRLALLIGRDGINRYVVLDRRTQEGSERPFGANAEVGESSVL